MQEFDFIQPSTLPELAEYLLVPGRRMIAGGTDLLPKLKRNPTADECLVDLSQLNELHELRLDGDQIIIGSMMTHARLAASTLIQTHIPALVQACGLVGCRQTRYRATIGGNLVNASPAADTAPVLLVRNAQLKLSGKNSNRDIPIDHFFVSPGKTCLAANEYLAAIQVPLPGRFWGETYLKLGQRNGMAICVASVAAYVELNPDGKIHLIRIAAGSVAPTPIRCHTVEAALKDKEPSDENILRSADSITQDISPIDDVRASKEYRLRASAELVTRAIHSAVEQAKARMA